MSSLAGPPSVPPQSPPLATSASIGVPEFWVDEVLGESPITAWDLLIMGGEIFPGVWKLEGGNKLNVDVARKFDPLTNLPALPTLTDKGYEPAKLKATGMIWLREDWDYLKELLPTLVPKKKSFIGGRDAFDLTHPAADLLGVSVVIVTAVSWKHPTEQTLVIEMELLEWFPETARGVPKKVRPNSKPIQESDFSTPNTGSNLTP